MQGLRRTRVYRHWTFYARRISRGLIKVTLEPVERLAISANLVKKQDTLLWQRTHIWAPPAPPQNTALPPHYVASPSIELTDYSTVLSTEFATQEVPAMPHSLFPPAISVRRARAEGFAFEQSPLPSGWHQSRNSDESVSPLVSRPVGAHQAGSQRSDSLSDEECSSGDALLEVSPPDSENSGLGLTAVMGRQRYIRANSDPRVDPDGRGGVRGWRMHGVDLERGGDVSG
jgi:hypothetical protein